MQDKSIRKGKVIKATRNHYLVSLAGQVITCSIRGKIAGAGSEDIRSVKVGDNVLVEWHSEREGVIKQILPRTSRLSRTVEGKAYHEHIIAVNIDQMVIIMSVKQPAFKSGLLDRYLVIAEKNKLSSVICLNKIDLAKPSQFDRYAACYRDLGYLFYYVSALNGEGLTDFKSILRNNVSVLVGHSGVGKSSLIQKIEQGLELRIAEISEKTSKGKHATSFVELFPLSIGGYVIDTPGVRELGLWDIFRDDLKHYFLEFRKYSVNCKFNDCNHVKEPDCAVKEAVDKGEIFPDRYRNYLNIYHDLRSAPYELLKKQ
jgi:ribosome biogenesis GTPase